MTKWLLSIGLGAFGAFTCGGWIILTLPAARAWPNTGYLAGYALCCVIAVRCLIYLCYEQFMRDIGNK
jgi:hypothetical protein